MLKVVKVEGSIDPGTEVTHFGVTPSAFQCGTHVDQSVGIETVHHTIKQVDVQETISLSLSTFIMSNYMHQQIVLVVERY